MPPYDTSGARDTPTQDTPIPEAPLDDGNARSAGEQAEAGSKAVPETTQATTWVFFRPATQERPHPECIDAVHLSDDGVVVGRFSGKTQSALAQQYRCEILVTDTASFYAMQDASYVTEPEIVTESDFTTALECLPPMEWGTWLGVESFRMSELYCGNVTSIYARTPDDRHWCFRDNAFMSGEDIARKVQAAASAAQPRIKG